MSEDQRRYFETVDSGYMTPTPSAYVNRQVDALTSFGNLQPHMQILEVGCGMGRYTLPLADRGYPIQGLDISPVLLQRLHDHDPAGRVLTTCASITDPPPGLSGQFDAVVGFFVLHHLGDLARAFESVRPLLRPGGRLVFLEPNPLNPLYYFQVTLSRNMHWWAERGIFTMRPKPVLGSMTHAGFVGPVTRTFGFLPPFAVNTGPGARLEPLLERPRIWRPFLPFRLFRADLASA